MIDKKAPNENLQQPRKGGKGRKPYQKPAFRHERVFETQALSCGKLTGTSVCGLSKKTS